MCSKTAAQSARNCLKREILVSNLHLILTLLTSELNLFIYSYTHATAHFFLRPTSVEHCCMRCMLWVENTCSNSAFNVIMPPSPPCLWLVLKPEWWVTPLSVGKRRSGMAGASAGGWEARGDKHRRWTQLDSHFQGPHILTTAGHVPIVTGADLIEGGRKGG